MVGQSFAQVERKIAAVQRDIDRLAWKQVGQALAPDIDAAVRGTLGDDSMSGWKRGSPIPITGSFRLLGADGVFMSAGKASGPMRVLQQGRNGGGGGGFAGPGISKSGTTRRTKAGGVAKVRARKAKRWNGTTAGKGTWAAASERMADKAPRLVQVQVHRVLKAHLTEG